MKHTTDTLPESLAGVFDLWRHVQVAFPNVVRFSHYHDGLGTRRQDNLAHCYSLTVTGGIYLTMLRQWTSLDEPLLHLAFQIHELGEGLLQRDVLYHNKTAQKDLEEYQAVKVYLHEHITDDRVRNELLRAFLVQFALDVPYCFPAEARTVMESLADHKWREVVVFDVIERIDYIKYGIEAFHVSGETQPLYEILCNQQDILRERAQELRCVEEVLWTPAHDAWATDFLERYA